MAQIILAKLWKKKFRNLYSIYSMRNVQFSNGIFRRAYSAKKESLNDRFGNEVVMKTGGKFGFY